MQRRGRVQLTATRDNFVSSYGNGTRGTLRPLYSEENMPQRYRKDATDPRFRDTAEAHRGRLCIFRPGIWSRVQEIPALVARGGSGGKKKKKIREKGDTTIREQNPRRRPSSANDSLGRFISGKFYDPIEHRTIVSFDNRD